MDPYNYKISEKLNESDSANIGAKSLKVILQFETAA